MAPHDPRRGALYMILASALFALMGALVKRVAMELSNEMVAFFRSTIGFIALLPWLLHQRTSLRTRRPIAHVTRALAGLASMYCFFYAIAHMPLGEAALLNYSAPLFIPFIAWLWLREPLSRRLLGAIALGFVGIALILKPGWSLFTFTALIGLASGVLAAVAMVGTRDLAHTDPASRSVFYYTLVCAVGSAIPMLWAWQMPSASLWGWIIALGVCASAAHLLMARAYVFAPAAQIGPFAYATVVFAGFLGWWFWQEIPDVVSALGAVVVVIAGALTVRLEARVTTSTTR